MGERWILSITQECERRTVLVLEIILGDLWYFVPVGILTGDLLEVDPALPTMVPAKREVGTMEYEGLSSVRSMLFSTRATTSWYS